MNKKSIVFILINLIIQSDSNKFDEFNCFEKEAKKLAESIKGLLINQDQIYLFYTDFILKFDAPLIKMKNSDRFLTYLISKPAYFMEANRLSSDKVTVLTLTDQIIGFIIDNSTNYIIHSKNRQNTNSYIINRLSFETVKCGEIQEWNYGYLKEKLFHSENCELIFLKMNHSVSYQITISTTKDDRRKIEFTYSEDALKYRSISFYNDEYRTKQLVYFENETDRSLIEIDDQNRLHISDYEFYSDSNNLLERKPIIRFDLSLDEFFNCKRPFKNENEIKGIFVRRNFFFIFINNFYLMIQSDLIKTGFRFDSNVYRTAKDLNFSGQIPIYYYLDRHSHSLIRNVEDHSYLAFDNKIFELNLIEDRKSNKNYLIAEVKKNDRFKDCSSQTLSIGNEVFCFDDSYYRYLFNLDDEFKDESKDDRKSSRRNILEIFEGSNIYWKSEKRLKFIFQYKGGFIVFMTDIELFCFKLKLLEVDQATKEITLIKKNLLHDEHFIVPNCLYDRRAASSCKTDFEVSTIMSTELSSMEIETDVSFMTNSNNTRISKSNLNALIVIFSFFIFLIIFFLAVTLIKKSKIISKIQSNKKISVKRSSTLVKFGQLLPEIYKNKLKINKKRKIVN